MKKILVVLFSIGIIFSCAKNEDKIESDLIGKWKLIEVLADPGDGSGTFQTVSSDKILEFFSDGTVTSNGSICYMSIDSNSSSTGIYSLSDSTLISSDCGNQIIKPTFEIKGSYLIIIYPCIEPCMAKYTKE